MRDTPARTMSAAPTEDPVNTYSPTTRNLPPVPPRLPGAERQRLRTETSATSGWAARLAAKFPDRGVRPGSTERSPDPARR